jgi:hypothetical protein
VIKITVYDDSAQYEDARNPSKLVFEVEFQAFERTAEVDKVWLALKPLYPKHKYTMSMYVNSTTSKDITPQG